MKILAIETSCDETAISAVAGQGGLRRPRFNVLAHSLASQTEIHAAWGGVVPILAKRAHGQNLAPLLRKTLKRAGLWQKQKKAIGVNHAVDRRLKTILAREPELYRQLKYLAPAIKPPAIDLLAVTQGPGLEPALWSGINFARALALLWRKPLMPVNHLAGHIYSVLLGKQQSQNGERKSRRSIKFPGLALLVSGGHTELVLVKDWQQFEVIGQTRDDACGEAFDKVARILGLPYPGGPEIGRLAASVNTRGLSSLPEDSPRKIHLPRPMIHSSDFDFSFSGLKTAVLYLVKKIGRPNEKRKAAIAKEFQTAAIDVLVAKTKRAIKIHRPATLIIAGGVAANQELRKRFRRFLSRDFPETRLLLPTAKLATDNATMIALAAYFRWQKREAVADNRLIASGNLTLS